jgi:anti-sigma B factor antagonist
MIKHPTRMMEEVTAMKHHNPDEPPREHAHFNFEIVDEDYPQLVTVEFLSRAIADPPHAAELSQQLALLLNPELPKKFVLDFQHVRLMSSTGFGALMSFLLKVREAGGHVKICNMDEFVRFGADVIRLGDYAEFATDEHTAIDELLDDQD